jgi:5,6,7,8-tetrahydromethanopterin hydro-lyase
MDTMMQIGEGFVGEGVNATHVNTVLGDRSGPVGAAWAAGLAGPSTGHAGFMVVGQPGISAVPPTLFVNKAAIADPDHGLMTWGPAQAGVAKGVALALDGDVIDNDSVGQLVLIAAVWVNPAAVDAAAVFANNTQATLQALRNGRDGRPSVADAMAAGLSPWNPFFRP